MKALLLICSVLLFLALLELPIGYYTLLRMVVTIGAVAIVIRDFKNGINFWIIAFGLIAILFNPLIPVYLNNKEIWMPIDVLAGLLFGIKYFVIKPKV